jgi:hypothetical protein
VYSAAGERQRFAEWSVADSVLGAVSVLEGSLDVDGCRDGPVQVEVEASTVELFNGESRTSIVT